MVLAHIVTDLGSLEKLTNYNLLIGMMVKVSTNCIIHMKLHHQPPPPMLGEFFQFFIVIQFLRHTGSPLWLLVYNNMYIMFVSCIVYVLKEVASFWGFSQLMSEVCKKHALKLYEQAWRKLFETYIETGINSCSRS